MNRTACCLAACLLLGLSAPRPGLWGQSFFGQRHLLTALDREASDQLGSSVVLLSEDRLVVGAKWERHNELGGNTLNGSGSAYVFGRDSAGNWQQVQKLVASDRSIGANFGSAMAYDDTDLLIAAPHEAQGLPGDLYKPSAGAVYVFRRDSSGHWEEVQKLVASDRSTFDYFGTDLAISGDYALIGAWGRDSAGRGGDQDNVTGAVYAFARDSSGYWQETQLLVIADTGRTERIGSRLDMDGTLAIVAAPGETEDENGANTLPEAGAAYLWHRLPDGQWVLHQKIVAHIRDADASGFARQDVAIWDSSVVVLQEYDWNHGLFAQYFRPDSSNLWQFVNRLSFPSGAPSKGQRIAMRDSLLLLGDEQWHSKRGRFHAFRMTPQRSWTYLETLTARDRSPNYAFAASMAIRDTTFLIGSPGHSLGHPAYGYAGAAYIFQGCSPHYQTWTTTICAGDSLWFEGAYVADPGTYTARYTNAQGCDSLIRLELAQWPPLDMGIVQEAGQWTAQDTLAAFQWLACLPDGPVPIPGATGAVFSPPQPGLYALVATQPQGCSDTSACLQYGVTGLEPAWAGGLRLFPNPSQGHLTLALDQPQPLHLSLWDPQGRRLLRRDLPPQATLSLDLPPTPGLYLLRLSDPQGREVVRKVVRE